MRKIEETNNLARYLSMLEESALTRREMKIIGELLVNFFEVEKALDRYVSMWFYPLIGDRMNILMDSIIIYTPLNKKLDFAKENNLIHTDILNKFHRIADYRNSLAHRRTEEKRPGRAITEDKKQQFINDCRQIVNYIHDKERECINRIREELKELLSVVPRFIVEAFRIVARHYENDKKKK